MLPRILNALLLVLPSNHIIRTDLWVRLATGIWLGLRVRDAGWMPRWKRATLCMGSHDDLLTINLAHVCEVLGLIGSTIFGGGASSRCLTLLYCLRVAVLELLRGAQVAYLLGLVICLDRIHII